MYDDDDQIEITLPIAIEQAVTLPYCVFGQLSITDLVIDEGTLAATQRAWCWLRGFDEHSPEGQAAIDDVTNDGPLFIALNQSACEFRDWFKAQGWSGWVEHENDPDDEWAYALLARAHAAVRAMGSLATQCKMIRV